MKDDKFKKVENYCRGCDSFQIHEVPKSRNPEWFSDNYSAGEFIIKCYRCGYPTHYSVPNQIKVTSSESSNLLNHAK